MVFRRGAEDLGNLSAYGKRLYPRCQTSELAKPPPGDVSAVFSILRQLCEAPGHQFWPEDLSILEILHPNAIITHAQITDIYLLGLAVHHGGKLATLDQHVPVHAIRGGSHALELIIT